MVHTALEQGVNYFDTAEVYNDGESERSLGVALKGRRTEAVKGQKDRGSYWNKGQHSSTCISIIEYYYMETRRKDESFDVERL